MGYLDNSTIVVDAILTKHGRKLLAQGQGLNISYFTVSDTGIDYTLWNADHASGSAFYGEAIEDLPNTEALSTVTSAYRNKLVTLNRDVVAMPTLEVTPAENQIFTTPDPITFTVKLLGYTLSGGTMVNGGNETLLLIPNINVACT